MGERRAGLGHRQLPLHGSLAGIARRFPGRYLLANPGKAGQPPIQTLAIEHRQLQLHHVQPTAVLGRITSIRFPIGPRPAQKSPSGQPE